ncbi:DUF1189 family protein [Candidatus Roizmanbacteria bacterium]|nr:DUF1189 family protein [Candidatus Roizmanbacteria bacterium]
MKKVALFFRILFLSFVNPYYYGKIITRPLSFSFQFYVIFQFLFSLVATVYILIRFVLPYQDFIEHLPDHLVRIYPDNLIVSINHGQVSTNVSEPYGIPFSEVTPLLSKLEKTSTVSAQTNYQNLLTIDTQAVEEDIQRHSTWALLTWDSFLYWYDGRIETVPLTTVEHMVITEELVTSISSQLQPVTRHLVLLLSILNFISFFIAGILRLIIVVLISFFLFPLARSILLPISWRNCFQISLHTSLLTQTIVAILSVTGIRYWFPFINIILLLGMGMFVVLVLKIRRV